MLLKPFMAALGWLLVLSALCWAQGDSLDVETLWRTGRFETARALIVSRREAGDRAPEFLSQAARGAEELRDYALAANLWQDYASLLTDDNNAYRTAQEHAWQCMWTRDAANAKAGWIATAQAEVNDRLRKAGAKAGAARQLALELDFSLQRITTGQAKPSEELRTSYPKSQAVLQAAKAMVDRLAAGSNDKQRLAGIKQFLADYPASFWRHAAYRLWLYSAWQLGDEAALRAAAQKYLAEYPQHPDSLGAVSRYFLEADIDRKAGLDDARASVTLYEKQLGTNGSPESLRQLDQQTRALPLLPDWSIAGKRQQFTDYLGSRYNLARYLVAAGDGQGALSAVQAVLDAAPFSPEEELTLAPFHIIAGQVAQLTGDASAAYRHFLAALVQGDSRGRAVVMAQSGLNTAAQKVSAADQAAIAAEFVPRALYKVPLPVFADVTKEAGLEDQHARRVAWGDVNADGALDLLLDGGALLLQAGRKFSDRSQVWGLGRGKLGGVFADIDNDGDLDLYAYGGGQRGDRLLRNEGDHFADVTAIYGDPTDDYQTEAAAFTDMDGDGWIDLYVANSPGRDLRPSAGFPPGAPDVLYRNDGTGKLVRQAPEAVGLVPPFGQALAGHGVSCADFDNDGDQDIFIGNGLAQENLLWRNDGGVFVDAARLIGMAGWKSDAGWGNTNGSDWGDANNDGNLELFVCNYVNTQHEDEENAPQLLLGQPGVADGQYSDKRAASGISFASTLTDAVWFDCNNDGWLDLYLTAAYEGRRSYLYINDGQGGFHDMTYLARARLLNTWGCAWADYDRDGDLDLLAASPDGVHLLRNDTPPQNWIEIECVGAAAGRGASGMSNRAAIGARVRIVAEGLDMLREIQSATGPGCGNELLAHFGLGQGKGRISIVVRFPSGRTATRAIVGGNQRLVFAEEGQGAAPVQPQPPAEQPPAAQPQPQQEGKGDAVTRPPSGRTR
jgi:hypothetical protein